MVLLNDIDQTLKIPEIQLSEYEGTLISKGGEGSVFRYDLPGRLFGLELKLKRVAVKQFEGSHSTSSDKTKSNSSRGHGEVLALCKLRHEHIIPILGVGTLKGERSLIMEYCPRTLAGVIDERRRKDKYLKYYEFWPWIISIVRALCFIHERGHYHGDLKPLNILISIGREAKVADFGLSGLSSSRGAFHDSNRGTARYMAPEQHAGEMLDLEGFKKCDVWAFGIVLWEMITCQLPFSAFHDHQISSLIGAKNENSHPVLPNTDVCEALVNLLKKCWSSKSINRLSMFNITRRLLDIDFDKPEDEASSGVFVDYHLLKYGKKYDEKLWREECKLWASARSDLG
ncbi:hypothetical protein PENTCL1PPCAC_12873, partial [Pristionchus entomophagus]